MDSLLQQPDWGLLIAGALIALVIVVQVIRRVFLSRHGLLKHSLGELAKQQHLHRKATNVATRAENRLDRLMSRSETVKPRLVDEAKGALQDARSLEKIAVDKVLIARNRVRQIIHEEFPPNRQARLRQKYLPDDDPAAKPFTY